MPTTSLKLPEDLKNLAADAARREGVSTHAFMVEAIRSAVAVAEQRAAFLAEALAARADAIQTGLGVDSIAAHDYLRSRVRGQPSPRPKVGRWRD